MKDASGDTWEARSKPILPGVAFVRLPSLRAELRRTLTRRRSPSKASANVLCKTNALGPQQRRFKCPGPAGWTLSQCLPDPDLPHAAIWECAKFQASSHQRRHARVMFLGT
eukprot:TRINITY_DN93149_c0_g1_i1.p1 TRINITY_DN93149_c0_g1~~TRINITY_DN93149_c0_g1_i1.p1  ORF type:complete len:111 (+),score=0.76 TRINITY_DN93149_c0_g1_i1:89-421(+)